MNKAQPAKSRVQRFLAKMTNGRSPGWVYFDAPDSRQKVKVEHPMPSILWALELGLTSNQPTLRDVETMTESLGLWARKLVPARISDTTLDSEAQRLDADYLHEQLVLRIRGFHRSKMLEPVGLPFGVVTVDGKNLATLDHDAEGTGHKRSSENEKWHWSKADEAKRGDLYYLMPALRATLSSAEAKPCIYQFPLPVETGEATVFPALLDCLKHAYGHGRMFEVIDGDAGLTSLAKCEQGYRSRLSIRLRSQGQPTGAVCRSREVASPACRNDGVPD